MWHEQAIFKKDWRRLWYGLIICPKCLAIRGWDGECPVCGAEIEGEAVPVMVDGKEEMVPTQTYMGAEARIEDYVYVQMLEREWKRPLTESDNAASKDPHQMLSPRSAIVILFWSYFETRIDRLLRDSMRDIPPKIVEDLLQRYSGVDRRCKGLYKILFDTTYWEDLRVLGHDRIKEYLLKVQEHRNAFAHGDPNAIDDDLVKAVVNNLKDEHDSWIAVFNKRATRQL